MSKWISVSDEWPELDTFVLVNLSSNLSSDYYDPIQIMSLHLRESTEEDNVWIAYWKTQERSVEFDAEDIIAWMPLPEPYKAESEGEE